MDQVFAEKLATTGEEVGIDCKLYENYSGRSMYGRKTTGIVVEEEKDFYKLLAFLNIEEAEVDVVYELDYLRSDRLGKQLIYY